MEAAGEGGAPNARKLGWFLAKHEGRIEDGRRFRRGEERRAGALWHVETVAKGAGFAGSAGFASPTREQLSRLLFLTLVRNGVKRTRKRRKTRRLASTGLRRRSTCDGRRVAARGRSGRRHRAAGRRQAQGRRHPPPELLARLREHKPAIVEILKADRCRWCGEPLGWPRPAGVVLGDGLAECMPCVDREVGRIWASAQRAVESPDALTDPAEVMLRGEIT